MPRTSRLIIPEQKAVYHVMSRTALDGFPLKDVEKDFMLDLIKRLSAFYLAEIFGIRLAIIFRPKIKIGFSQRILDSKKLIRRRRTSVSKAQKSGSEDIAGMFMKPELWTDQENRMLG
jgi:hypothetical protein